MSEINERVELMLRESGLKFFVADNSATYLAEFAGKSGSCVVSLRVEEDETVIMKGVGLPAIDIEGRDAKAILEELLALNAEFAFATVGRDPESGHLTAVMSWVPTVLDGIDIADMLEAFAGDVLELLYRVMQVRDTGRTRYQRRIDEGIDRLFNPPAQTGETVQGDQASSDAA